MSAAELKLQQLDGRVTDLEERTRILELERAQRALDFGQALVEMKTMYAKALRSSSHDLQSNAEAIVDIQLREALRTMVTERQAEVSAKGVARWFDLGTNAVAALLIAAGMYFKIGGEALIPLAAVLWVGGKIGAKEAFTVKREREIKRIETDSMRPPPQ